MAKPRPISFDEEHMSVYDRWRVRGSEKTRVANEGKPRKGERERARAQEGKRA
jgi:hypothetical protein